MISLGFLLFSFAMNEQTFSTSFTRVKELAENFQASEQRYLESSYSESQARIDFIDKFWIALGWDVNHERERNPYEQEVKVERGVAVSNRLKKADYAFFAAPNFRDVKFYVEAKKPSRNLDNADDYFQTIRYGWSSNTPLAVLTDFEQFRLIDCRYKPNIATAQNFALEDVKFNYRDYADEEKFRKIYHLFSRESVINGSLEDYAKSLPKRGRGAKQGRLFAGAIQKSVDESFLDDLDGYREELARAFKNKNAELDGEDLTEAVTRTLDRLVFIRFLEDKLIEPDTMIDKFNSSADFVRACKSLESRYNGIVFKKHFIDETNFKTDEKVFTDICGELSSPTSSYYLGNIPAFILGSVYERFLGKVIVATDKRARVEPKPEVRKAGGVYYTPEYIVRYIVENTIGRLILYKSPKEISEMRFADIACGSGSFLLGVYDFLLRYHIDYYNSPGKKGEARAAGCFENTDGSFILTIAQRREILRNNIYGVDIDAQATEVAQLSLALKLLEDATTGTIRIFQPKIGEKILPDMTKNIVCGNSLIDHDILDGQLFERNEERKLNPMSYEDKFPEIMRRGGFDAIVGNPPYVRPHNLDIVSKEYFWKNYTTFTHKADLYCCFVEKATNLLLESGKISYIVSNGWLRLNSFQNLRKHILDNYQINELLELPFRVFAEASVNADVFIFQKQESEQRRVNDISIIEGQFSNNKFFLELKRKINQESFENTFENVFDTSISSETEIIKDKMRRGLRIGEVFDIRFGLKTGDDSKFLHITSGLHSEDKPLLRGDDVKRYSCNYKGEFVWYVPQIMRQHRQTARPGEKERFEQPKVLVKDTSTDFAGTYDDQNFYVKDVLVVTPKENLVQTFNLKFLTGLINSRALYFYYRTTFKTLHVQSGELASLPLPSIDFVNKNDKVMHDKMVALVEQMLEAKKQLQAARTDKDKNFYQDRCNRLDGKIDELVYDLYELTPQEIKIVKGEV